MSATVPAEIFWILLLVWLVAGIADYALHRRTHIETTSGAHESWLHVLQAAQIGVGLLAGLFLEINSLVLAILIVCVVAHTLTALWDSSYSNRRRYISPVEQHVHSHLEYIPLVTVALVALVHWDSFENTAQSWTLQPKKVPLPALYIVAVLLSVFGVQGALLAEEVLRCQRNREEAK